MRDECRHKHPLGDPAKLEQEGEGEEYEEDEGEEADTVVHLEDSFPGKLRAAPVLLRSTATWEGRVDGIESSGPRLRTTLTRRDVPGVSATAAAAAPEKGTGAARGGSECAAAAAAPPGVVEVSRSDACVG